MSEFWLVDSDATARCFRELNRWALPDVPRDYSTFLATPFPAEFTELVDTPPTMGEEARNA